MDKTIIKFDDIEIEKQNFHQDKRATSIKKIQILIKQQFGEKGFKYFIGYKNADKFRLLCIFFRE